VEKSVASQDDTFLRAFFAGIINVPELKEVTNDNIKYIGEYRNSRYVTVIPKLVRGWIGVISVHRIQSVTMQHRSGLLVYSTHTQLK